jgi:hypothetical protein
MDISLYSYLPSVLQPLPEASPDSTEGYTLWLEVINALDEPFFQQITLLNYQVCDRNRRMKPLDSQSRLRVASMLDSYAGALSCFDRAVQANSLTLPLFQHSADERLPLLEWHLGGRVFGAARLKYFEGRYYLFHHRLKLAQECAEKLRLAGLLFLHASHPDVYPCGTELCWLSFALMCEMIPHNARPIEVAKDAVAFALSILRVDYYLRSFFGSQSRWALACLEGLFNREPLLEILRLLSVAFREQRDTEEESCVDLSLPKHLAIRGSASRSQAATSASMDAGGSSRRDIEFEIGEMATLVGIAAERCISAFGDSELLAKESLAAMTKWPLRDLLRSTGGSRLEHPLETRTEFTDSSNSLELVFVARFAAAMGEWGQRNAFLWYSPLQRFCRAAVALAVRTFREELRRDPASLQEVVDHGILPFVPTDPRSGEPFDVLTGSSEEGKEA